jgi:hypothetical protein
MKREYRDLRDLPGLTPSQAARLADLESTLSTMPDWSRASKLDRETLDVLHNVEHLLKAAR